MNKGCKRFVWHMLKRKLINIRLLNKHYLIIMEIKNNEHCSDEDLPLSKLKGSLERKTFNKKILPTERNNKSKLLVKKQYKYHKGKKVFTKSDSESSDFEKYTYFDEGKIKRKVKIDEKLSNEELMDKIKQVTIENVCLMREHERINDVKLQERIKLREEIIRLKNRLVKLELEKHIKNLFTPPQKQTNVKIIDMIRQCGVTQKVIVKENIIDEDILTENINKFPFTQDSFWEKFNEIERKVAPNGPYWTGDLNHISPYCDVHFEPRDDVITRLSYDEIVKKYPNFSFTLNGKLISKKSTLRKTTDFSKLPADLKCRTEGLSANIHMHPSNEDCVNDLKAEKSTGDDEEYGNDSDGELLIDENPHNDCIIEDDSQEFAGTIQVDSQKSISSHSASQIDSNQDQEEGLCVECGHGTSWKSFVQRHREAYNQNLSLPPCNTCNMKFLESGHFDGRHRLKRPPPLRRRPALLMCTECGQRCTSKSGLKQHSLRHRDAQFACSLCSYKCRRKAYLKIHMKVHDLKKNLKTTEIADSNVDSNDKSHPSVPWNKKPSYSCVYCNYTTTSKSYLKCHINYHTGHKGFKCDECPYQCVTSTRLKIHKKVHRKSKSA